MSDQEMVELDVFINAETDAAILIDDGDGKVVWLPKSQVTIHDKDHDPEFATKISVVEWLAVREGLV
jgi:hypothetical protein